MTTLLAGIAIGTVLGMGILWMRVLGLQDDLEHHHRITRSALARIRRLERQLARRNGTHTTILETPDRLPRPFTVEHADPAHWDDVAIQLAAYRNIGEGS